MKYILFIAIFFLVPLSSFAMAPVNFSCEITQTIYGGYARGRLTFSGGTDFYEQDFELQLSRDSRTPIPARGKIFYDAAGLFSGLEPDLKERIVRALRPTDPPLETERAPIHIWSTSFSEAGPLKFISIQHGSIGGVLFGDGFVALCTNFFQREW